MPWRRTGKWRSAATFSTSAVDRGWWSYSRPGLFITEESPGTHSILWISGKSLDPAGKRTPAVHPVALPYIEMYRLVDYSPVLIKINAIYILILTLYLLLFLWRSNFRVTPLETVCRLLWTFARIEVLRAGVCYLPLRSKGQNKIFRFVTIMY
jgi:hypothetical protein